MEADLAGAGAWARALAGARAGAWALAGELLKDEQAIFCFKKRRKNEK